MMLKTALLTALAAPAMAQTYSTPYAEVVVANAAKFADGTTTEVTQKALTVASLLAASTTTTVGALADVATALSGSASVTTISNTACQEAYRAASQFHYGDLSTTSLNDWNFQYAWRYVDEADYNEHVTALKACLTAMNPSNLATLTSSVDAAKVAITLYPGQIGLDWTVAADHVNPTSGDESITLTTSQKADYYNYWLLAARGWCNAEYFANSDAPSVVIDQYALTGSKTDASFVAAINPLDLQSADFTDVNGYKYAFVKEQKKNFIGDSNTYATYVSNRATILTELGFTTTTTTTLATVTTASENFDTCMTLAQSEKTAALANYNSASSLNTFGLLSMFLILLTQW